MKPLELFYKIKDYLMMEWGSSEIEELDIIENVLKNNEELIKENECYHYLMNLVRYTFNGYDFTLEKLGKILKAIEIIKECFNLNGFDELIPNSKWFESKEKQDLLKEVLL